MLQNVASGRCYIWYQEWNLTTIGAFAEVIVIVSLLVRVYYCITVCTVDLNCGTYILNCGTHTLNCGTHTLNCGIYWWFELWYGN